MDLIEHVRALEKRDNPGRGQYILTMLDSLDLDYRIQSCRFPRIKNIIVDFPTGIRKKRLLISAHYDAVRGSPGANDNASGVAVLLGLCSELKGNQTPARIVFFDREEAWLHTPILRLGLLGSLYYVVTTSLRNTSAVYNLEFCGAGDYLGIWPVKGKQNSISAVKNIITTAEKINLPYKLAHVPWVLLSSDHLPFRLKGFANSVTLSLFHADQVPVLEKFLSAINSWKVLFKHQRELPKPLNIIHSKRDDSSRLDENSLRLMQALLLELVEQSGGHN